ncbi:MAG: nitronate monooxygenase [Pseudomonadota bacterium]
MGRQALDRAAAFAADYALRVPILQAPMAGVSPPALSVAVARGGGMGACGALMMGADEIAAWAAEVRAKTNGAFQINTWIPGPPPTRDAAHEDAVAEFLAGFGPRPEPPEATPTQDFDAQCEAMLAAGPSVVSSIMGLYPPEFVARLKTAGVRWFAAATTVAEARAAVEAGADAVVAQGMEAGGHRGAFDADRAGDRLVGLFALLPAIADAVDVPVIATGGIADARGIAAAMLLGASAVQIGTGYLRTPEAAIARSWADAIGQAAPEDTVATRAFSGRLGRSLRTTYAEAAAAPEAPPPAPYPIQRALTGPMRAAAARESDVERMQAWAGQSARLAEATPAAELTTRLWEEAKALMQV